MSDKHKTSSAEGCGRFFGAVACCSLLGGVYGQICRWTGAIECDWRVVWGPALVLWFIILLLFALAGVILTVKESK